MEEDLKISKVEYLSKHWLNVFKILNLGLVEQTKSKNCLKWRRAPLEDDLYIFHVEYLSTHILDHSQISNLGLCGISQQPLIESQMLNLSL